MAKLALYKLYRCCVLLSVGFRGFDITANSCLEENPSSLRKGKKRKEAKHRLCKYGHTLKSVALNNQKSENEPQAKGLDLIFYSTLGPAGPSKNAVQNSCISPLHLVKAAVLSHQLS